MFFFQNQAITPKNCEVALKNSTEKILVRFLQHPVRESSFCLFAKIRGSPNLRNAVYTIFSNFNHYWTIVLLLISSRLLCTQNM